MKTILRYDGKYDGFPPTFDTRSWTLMSHFVDSNGCDRFRGSFGVAGLTELGVLSAANYNLKEDHSNA